MPIVVRILLVLLLLAAVPLRGYAAVSVSACEMHHGEAAAQSAIHDHSVDEPQVPHHHGSNGATPASACIACAGCCVGPSHAPGAVRLEPFGQSHADRIPYLGKQVPVHVADRLDRPPLAL